VIATPLYHAPIRIADKIARRARLQAIGDLTEYGLPIPQEGLFARNARLGVAPAIIDMEVIDAIRDGSIEVVKAPESFDGDTVSLVDGARLLPDVVVCATGYLRGWNRSWATSMCSTSTARRASSRPSRPPTACDSSAFWRARR
jgi:hypothetical protein